MDWSYWLALCAELDAGDCPAAERAGRAELLLLAGCRRSRWPSLPAWVLMPATLAGAFLGLVASSVL